MDRGVLILFAPNDRRDRVEVGYGLEPILPDGKVGGFEREIVPLLRQSDYSGAVLLITQRVAAVIAEDQKVTLDNLSGVSAPQPQPESDNSPAPLGNIVELLIIAVFIFFPLIGFLLRLLFGFGGSGRSRRGGGMWMGGPSFGGGSMGGGGSCGGGGGGGLAASAEDRLAAAARAGAGEMRVARRKARRSKS